MKIIAEKLILHRKFVLFISIVLTLLWSTQLIHLGIDASFSSVLPETDPDYIFNKAVEKEFGSSDELIVLITDDTGIYSDDVLDCIEEISAALAETEHVDKNKIVSMLTLAGTRSLSELSDYMRHDPLAAGTLVNSAETTTMIIAPVSGELGLTDAALKAFVNSAYAIVEKIRLEYPGLRILVSGHPIVNAEIMAKMANDLYVLFPLAVIAVAVMLLIILRSVRGMLIPLLITLMAVIWTFGLKGLLRSPLTITETAIPVILISISCADGIHIVSEAFHFMHHGMNSRDAIIRTIDELWKPVVLTSLTTALGFSSFIFSSGTSLRNMGLFLAFGVMSAMMFSLFFIPVLFSWYKPVRLHENRTHYKRQYKLLRRIEHITEKFIKWRFAVIVLGGLLLAFSVGGIMNINTDTDEIRYFKQGNPIRNTAEFIEDEMGGLSVLQIVLEGDPESFKSAEILQDIAALEVQLKKRPEVSTAVSLADSVAYMFYTMRGRNPEFFMIPENSIFVERLISLLSSGEDERADMLSAYVNADFSRARILVRLNNSNTRVLEKMLKDIDSSLSVFRDKGITVRFAGDYTRLTNGRIIVESQVLSLTLTLGIILIVLSIIYRSFLNGLFVSIPVVIAVLLNFSVMWLFNVSLNPATAIISAVGLGVGIDYSIHIFSRFRMIHRHGDSLRSSLVNAVVESARGIISNAVSVGIGFLILLFSAYRIINDMGWIIALTMLTTSAASLIILPCLLSLLKPKLQK